MSNDDTIAIISGSSRKNSQSRKVADNLKARLQNQHKDQSVEIIDLAQISLPNWDEELWSVGAARWDPNWSEVSTILGRTSGVIIVAPEWGGMVPAVLKNFFLLCGSADLAHKPGLIVAVSSGINGAYPISELRMSSYKNTHICYIPNQLIIRNVENVLNEHVDQPDGESTEQTPSQSSLDARVDHTLDVFMAYIEGMKRIRNQVMPSLKAYPYGM